MVGREFKTKTRRVPLSRGWRSSCLCFFFVFAFALVVTLPRICTGEAPIPALTGRVIDQTGTLTEVEQHNLNNVLAGLEQTKGAQVAVLIVRSTDGEAIESFALRVVENWKLGRKGIDDGALLLIAKDDRAVRIEIGYGLEGAVPDVIAKRIVEEQILPFFRSGDLPGGVRSGVEALTKVISGESLPPPLAQSKDEFTGAWMVIVFGALMFGSATQPFLGRAKSGVLAGILAALIGLLIYSLTISVLLGIFAGFIATFADSSNTLPFRSPRRGRGGFGGGFGGGGFSGGGFSGGGGGFGGGGASGRW